jgi:hypothetical protein
MQVIIHLPVEEVNGNMGARSGAAMRRVAAIRANRLSRPRHPFVAFAEAICAALLLGLFGAGAGASWSLAFGFGAGIGALCGGLGVFALGVVLVPLDARAGKAFPLVAVALVILAAEMALGAIVWGIRVALG